MRYLIVGDTIIDENIYLKAIGLSLETPTLKTEFKNRDIVFGGASNVAIHLTEMDKEVTLLTSISNERLRIIKRKYPNLNIINFFQGMDNIKTRYWVSHGDSEYKYLQVNSTNDESTDSKLIGIDFDSFDVIAFSDYRCGLIKPSFIKECLLSGKKSYASSQVSTRLSNYDKYTNVDIIVCNQKESETFKRHKDVCITMGSKGCKFNDKYYPTKVVKNTNNTIGAGDIFYAAFLATEDPNEANKIASNYLINLN